MAEAIQADFSRIQFTPDLLPADLVGTLIYNQKEGTFVPKKGPVFTNFLLADEINRAPAKTQSALLEAMQERQVIQHDPDISTVSLVDKHLQGGGKPFDVDRIPAGAATTAGTALTQWVAVATTSVLHPASSNAPNGMTSSTRSMFCVPSGSR